MRRVVVTAVGVVTPIGNSLSAFSENLFGGRSGACRLGDVFEWLGGKSGKRLGAPVVEVLPVPRALEHQLLHRSEVFAACALQQVLTGLDPQIVRNAPLLCGVGHGQLFPSSAELSHEQLGCWLAGMEKRELAPARYQPEYRSSAAFAESTSMRLLDAFGMQGPTQTFYGACAAGSQAFIQACEEIIYGGLDVAVAGAHDSLLSTGGLYMMAQLGTLTENVDPATSIRPFDLYRDGTMLGEGAAYLLLEEAQHAVTRGATILGEIAGFGTSLDGYHPTSPDPAGTSGVRMIRDALTMADLPPESVDYVNAHGTATTLNDAAESRILGRALDGHRPYVSSTKAQVGHLIAACGAVELVAALCALREQRIPPNLNFRNPDPECDLRVPVDDSPRAVVDHALCNSFGFGGQNACLLLRRWA